VRKRVVFVRETLLSSFPDPATDGDTGYSADDQDDDSDDRKLPREVFPPAGVAGDRLLPFFQVIVGLWALCEGGVGEGDEEEVEEGGRKPRDCDGTHRLCVLLLLWWRARSSG
jgi:hypothetical protein